MTDEPATDDGGDVLTLSKLVSDRMRERGWTLGDLVAHRRNTLSKSRWQQYATGARLKNVPDTGNLLAISEVLEVDVTTVILAAARQVGLGVRRRGSDFSALLPTGVDELPESMRDAILAIIRAAVADMRASGVEDDEDEPGANPRRGASVLEWNKSVETRRNAAAQLGEDRM